MFLMKKLKKKHLFDAFFIVDNQVIKLKQQISIAEKSKFC